MAAVGLPDLVVAQDVVAYYHLPYFHWSLKHHHFDRVLMVALVVIVVVPLASVVVLSWHFLL